MLESRLAHYRQNKCCPCFQMSLTENVPSINERMAEYREKLLKALERSTSPDAWKKWKLPTGAKPLTRPRFENWPIRPVTSRRVSLFDRNVQHVIAGQVRHLVRLQSRSWEHLKKMGAGPGTMAHQINAHEASQLILDMWQSVFTGDEEAFSGSTPGIFINVVLLHKVRCGLSTTKASFFFSSSTCKTGIPSTTLYAAASRQKMLAPTRFTDNRTLGNGH